MIQDFDEEKEYYRWNNSPIGDAWSNIGSELETKTGIMIDKTIQPFLTLVNLLPYAYTPGMSCSGSSLDHSAKKINRNERYGILVSEPQGYCVIRGDTQKEGWSNFELVLMNIPDSVLTPSNKWERKDTREEELFPNSNGVTLFSYQIFFKESQTYNSHTVHEAWEQLSKETLALIQTLNHKSRF